MLPKYPFIFIFYFLPYFSFPQVSSPVDTAQNKQSGDSLMVVKQPEKKPVTYFFTEKAFDKGSYSEVDTTLDFYHYYVPGFYQNYKTLGNTGSPGQMMYYGNPENVGFNMGINFLDAYASKKEDVRYFNTRRPYSKVFFLMGTREEQILNVKHSQNIGRTLNFGLDYTNITSAGFYQRQKTRGNDFHFHLNYETKNKWYGNFGNFVYHKMTVEENGGLYIDAYFEENSEARKDALQVNLQNASNTYKRKSWFFKQYLNLGKRENIFDAKDSVNRKVVSPVLRLAHTFSFEKQIYSYLDVEPDSSQYLDLFTYNRMQGPLDTIHDSLNVKIYENTISLSTVDFTDLTGRKYGFKNFFSSVFFKHQDIRRLTHNDNFDSGFQNLIAGADLNLRFLKMFSAGGNAVQVLDGFNKEDHYYKGFLELAPGSIAHRVHISSFHQVKHPDWVQTHYFSDQLQWQNEFLNSSYSGQSIYYWNEKWKIKLGISRNYYKNPVYFSAGDIFNADTVFIGNGIVPRQREERFTINQIFLNTHFKLWRFHLRNNVYYQETNNEVILPFPELITYNSFYYEGLMLRKSLYAQIGVDFYYHSSYFANAYSPFLKQFYLQQEKAAGDYPFLDFFVNFKIKSVRAFFKITHFNSGFSGNTYYAIPHYPYPDRAYRFGIDWRFLD